MSEIFHDEDHRRATRKRGCLPAILLVLALLVVLGGGAWFAKSRLESLFGSAPDYTGAGSGSVLFEVHQGDSSAEIGRNLKAKGVVKSVDAFTEAARKNSKATGIQVGYYQLRKKIPAATALDTLINPKNLVQSLVTVTEGARVKDIVATITKRTDITRASLQAALASPASIGLPAEANGNAEGYLFPATYAVPPKMTATALLSQMVAKTKQTERSLDIAARAKALGYSVAQVMTLASVLEYEGLRDEDLPKIARVFYNRLDKGMALQSDATVAYANNLSGTVWTTKAQRENPSPYNTYAHTGLPPGPIGSPGERTLEATLNPAKGGWLFFVPINLKTGETAFASTLAEHNRNVAKLRAWCAQTHSDNCN